MTLNAVSLMSVIVVNNHPLRSHKATEKGQERNQNQSGVSIDPVIYLYTDQEMR